MTEHLLKNKINVAVITGGHPFDVPSFVELFRNMKNINFYLQAVENFAADWGKTKEKYDVVVFYNMCMDTPTDERGWLKVTKASIEEIADRGQGIVILHHALLAYPHWDTWGDLCGIRDRDVHDGPNYINLIDQTVRYNIVNKNHPITKGIDDWEMIDEIYKIDSVKQEDICDLLITTDHPESMKSIAWTKEYKNSKVFCYQAGHDSKVFDDENFRIILEQGIQWVASKI